MRYFDHRTLLYSDTPVSDIFISEYLPSLRGDYVKVYVYCVFLAQKGRTASVVDMARVLELPLEAARGALRQMDGMGLLSYGESGVELADLKQRHIERLYKLRSTVAPEDAVRSLHVDEKRSQAVRAINDEFYNGAMSPDWLGRIAQWFDIYGFDADVMYMLFSHCASSKSLGTLNVAYVSKVADDWHKRGVRNAFDVDRAMKDRKAAMSVSRRLQKKLRLNTPFTEFQEQVVDKWVNSYKFPAEVIELAFEQGKWKLEVGLKYYDAILERWHAAGLDTVEKVAAYNERRRSTAFAAGAGAVAKAGGGAATGGGMVAKTGGAAATGGMVGGMAVAGGGVVGAAGPGRLSGGAYGGAGRRRYSQSAYPQREPDEYSFSVLDTNLFGGYAGEGSSADGSEAAADADAVARLGAGAGVESWQDAVACIGTDVDAGSGPDAVARLGADVDVGSGQDAVARLGADVDAGSGQDAVARLGAGEGEVTAFGSGGPMSGVDARIGAADKDRARMMSENGGVGMADGSSEAGASAKGGGPGSAEATAACAGKGATESGEAGTCAGK